MGGWEYIGKSVGWMIALTICSCESRESQGRVRAKKQGGAVAHPEAGQGEMGDAEKKRGIQS